MSAFEQQGTHATSCEPFDDWCNETGIDLSVHSTEESKNQEKTKEWNNSLLLSHAGEVEAASEAFEIFKSLDK